MSDHKPTKVGIAQVDNLTGAPNVRRYAVICFDCDEREVTRPLPLNQAEAERIAHIRWHENQR